MPFQEQRELFSNMLNDFYCRFERNDLENERNEVILQ